jgi:putative SOS response-associated peptidase YedK
MCGRFTRKYTWHDLMALYRLTSPASNLEERFNVCPTDVVDTVVPRVLTIAGLRDRWTNRETGETLQSCSMVITEPNKFVGELHDRMPVILEPKDFAQWEHGDPQDAAELMKPCREDMLQKWPVSKRINSSRAPADDASLIERVSSAA